MSEIRSRVAAGCVAGPLSFGRRGFCRCRGYPGDDGHAGRAGTDNRVRGGIAPAEAARGIRQRPVPDAPLGRACGYARLIGLPCARTGHRRGTGGHSGGYPGRALLNLFLFHFSASGRSENSARFRSPKREGSAAAKNPPLGIPGWIFYERGRRRIRRRCPIFSFCGRTRGRKRRCPIRSPRKRYGNKHP